MITGIAHDVRAHTHSTDPPSASRASTTKTHPISGWRNGNGRMWQTIPVSLWLMIWCPHPDSNCVAMPLIASGGAESTGMVHSYMKEAGRIWKIKVDAVRAIPS